MRRIVICADDFGMNPAVDDAILRLAGMGRASAASCLALGPSFAANAAALRAAGADVGLHLNLTESLRGEPAMPLPALLARAYARCLDGAWIDAAIQRQLDAFESACGRAPDYVDGHRHVHQLPGVLMRLLEALHRRYGRRRPWLRCTLPRAIPGAAAADAFKARVIGALGGAALRHAAHDGGWRTNARLLGVYGLRGGAPHYAALLRQWLRAARDGDLLMCHPAMPAPSHADALSAQRAAEFEVLSGNAVAAWLRDCGVAVVRPGRTGADAVLRGRAG